MFPAQPRSERIGSSGTLAGRGVVLRPYRTGFSDEELEAVYRWANDDEVLALAGGVQLDMSFEEFREAFARQVMNRNGSQEQLFAILDAQGRLIGRTGLFSIGEPRGTAELGIVIGEHDCWGRGYGREAVGLLLEFAFRRLGLQKVVLHTYPGNLRAQRAFAAVGFRRTGRRQGFCLRRGTFTEITMEIEANEHGLRDAQPARA